ncbi:hypothetical protein TNCV_4037191 [Trichonephila clavipes]|nr:hypothetical protein TNCV_4037191 [Trichonephila clavipes]
MLIGPRKELPTNFDELPTNSGLATPVVISRILQRIAYLVSVRIWDPAAPPQSAGRGQRHNGEHWGPLQSRIWGTQEPCPPPQCGSVLYDTG